MDPKISVHITGTGRAVPDRVLTNADLEKMVDTSDEWITTRSGIKRRHILEPGQMNSDFVAQACRNALAAAAVDAADIDFLLVGTITGDLIFPSTACLVQEKIGAKNAAAWDLSAACSGWLYGVKTATALLKTGMGRRALVVGSEMLSTIVDWSDRGTCVLFGDGSGAVVLEAREDQPGGVLATYARTDGGLAELLHIPKGGSRHPVTPEVLAERSNKVHMKGNEVFKHAVRNMESAAREVLAQAGLGTGDVSLLIPHQANIRIIKAIASRLEIEMERVYVNLQEYGNTSAASIPIALDEARRSGRVTEGDRVLMAAFGGGLTWGAALVQF